MLLTADHGNSETMVNEATGKPQTAHTTNEVPFVLINAPKGVELKSEQGALCNIAPTVLQLLGIKKPEEMTVMKVDENGDLTDQLESAVVVADRTPKSTATPEKKYGRFFRGSASLEGQRAYDALFNANRNAGG